MQSEFYYEPPLTQLRPQEATLFLSQGRTVMSADRTGCLENSHHGLFFFETRLVSRWKYRLGRRAPVIVAFANVDQHSWLAYYLQAAELFHDADVRQAAEHAVELKVSRFAGSGLHEDIDITNYTGHPIDLPFVIEVDGDFADQTDTSKRVPGMRVQKAWSVTDNLAVLEFFGKATHNYSHQGDVGTAKFERGVRIVFSNFGSSPSRFGCRIGFTIRLNPGEHWHTCVDFCPVMQGKEIKPAYSCNSFFVDKSQFGQKRCVFIQTSTEVDVRNQRDLTDVVHRAVERAKYDLAALRLVDIDHGEHAWTMAAGMPSYIALFGRDTLTASWQAGMLTSDMMRGTLIDMANWQGKKTDFWRDERPGRMLHEAHTGPLEELEFNPRKAYYGSVTSSGLYATILSEMWHWTNESAFLEQHLDAALNALESLENYNRLLPGRHFFAYKTTSSQGLRNQAWKDSDDAIVYSDGRLAEPPIATCEEQGFIHLAMIRAAEMLWWQKRKDEAAAWYHKAEELKKRFNEAFWMPDQGTFALGLDSHGKQIDAVASNPGHCVAMAIVDDALVERCVNRMFEPDLFSGWGVRTLSAQNPLYNPMSYHRGSIWPVEQATFVVGFVRYGLWEQAVSLTRSMFEVAQLFENARFPEVFAGHPRDDSHPFPAFYPGSNAPQAWSASTPFLFIQAMLGLYPYAPLKLLMVDPHLPVWLPELTVRNLHVGSARITLKFRRRSDGKTDYHILEQQGELFVVNQPSPWSLTAGPAERAIDFLTSILH